MNQLIRETIKFREHIELCKNGFLLNTLLAYQDVLESLLKQTKDSITFVLANRNKTIEKKLDSIIEDKLKEKR